MRGKKTQGRRARSFLYIQMNTRELSKEEENLSSTGSGTMELASTYKTLFFDPLLRIRLLASMITFGCPHSRKHMAPFFFPFTLNEVAR